MLGEMAGALASGLTQVLTPGALGLMLVGIGLGFAVGILPGLGGPTTLALDGWRLSDLSPRTRPRRSLSSLRSAWPAVASPWCTGTTIA